VEIDRGLIGNAARYFSLATFLVGENEIDEEDTPPA